jgi:hypothetical protein
VSVKKLLILLIVSFLLLELSVLITNFYFFHWELKEHKVDASIITLILILFVHKFREKNRHKLEGKDYYWIFALFSIFILIFKALLHVDISYYNQSETLYLRFNEIFYDKIWFYILGIGGNIWVGIWLGNGNGDKFWKKNKTKIYSSTNEELVNKVHKVFIEYQIDSLIEKNKEGYFELMINDDQNRIKATQLLESIINKY